MCAQMVYHIFKYPKSGASHKALKDHKEQLT